MYKNHKKWSMVTPKKDQQKRNFLNIKIASQLPHLLRRSKKFIASYSFLGVILLFVS